ncbi:hypothetical protein NIASO_05750 [Niabella soli DSM 19437]|uniref:Beta-glucuronidase C-terminal domain-containing protein n=1 Tax=Niabella soli DSM 19437 TaxID=929713 RepID=W0F037_9BACT|nr:hypothetical protein NIASO_05750 [Niabella soli DSM 19437]
MLWLALFGSCTKSSTPPLPPPQGAPVTLVLHPDQPGDALPATFTGFSYETSALTDGNFLSPSNTVLIQLIRNLGRGFLRVGGNSSDNLVWTGGPRSAQTGKDSLTTSDIDHFAAFANAVGWPVIFGFNMGVFDPARVVSEGTYLNNSSLKNTIAYLQNGNEPDLFAGNGHRSATFQLPDYEKQWEQYYTAIKSNNLSFPFAGPDVAYNTKWTAGFSASESHNIGLLTAHYYRTGPASDTTITYKTILADDTRLPTYLDALNTDAKAVQLPYRIAECNSVYSGGRKGVSDVFASALWALDFMWTAAMHHCQGVNFHGGQGGAYTPIAMTNGIPIARPEYYALLAFHAAAMGRLIPGNVSGTRLNVNIFACADTGTEYVTIINKEEQQAIALTIQPGIKAQTAQALALTAPGLTATSGITFAGSQPDASGNFAPQKSPVYAPTNGNIVIAIPAGSAMVVIIK